MQISFNRECRIGTCGYSYPGDPPKGWHGVFYPKVARTYGDELAFYTLYFNTVEINTTFYRPASPSMAQAWVRNTPPDFRFAVKVWQKFTHPTQLGEEVEGSKERWERFDKTDVKLFTRGIAPLADSQKLGVLLFQYPASFVYNSENLDRLQDALSAFATYPKVVELRHRSWSDRCNETQALLAGSRAAWAYIDEPKFASSVEQGLSVQGDTLYVRLHGRNYPKWWKHSEAWERYDYLYSSQEIRLLAQKITRLAAKATTDKFYVFFNNHARGQAVANALLLKSELLTGDQKRAPRSLIRAFPDLSGFLADDTGQLEFI